ncbi:hypothetical protein IHE45_19G030800 [Dioscorea alata]|uniref:Uncharacterized protein n=1 Tax=Dioscorea alata TaxID=55571 RepID=A0ACB7TX39_DIOAL|nr:hypothetical protein IHE45_19G030800 [Dioscorea alata]
MADQPELGQQLKERFFHFVGRVRSFSFLSYTQEKQENEVIGETKIGTQVITERAFVLGAYDESSNYKATSPPEPQTN